VRDRSQQRRDRIHLFDRERVTQTRALGRIDVEHLQRSFERARRRGT
jgi:hypothetical protein